jgi:hypothetical protein
MGKTFAGWKANKSRPKIAPNLLVNLVFCFNVADNLFFFHFVSPLFFLKRN